VKKLAVSVAAIAAVSCKTTSEAARPDQPTAEEALEVEWECDPEELPDESTPLVVNWSESDRATLETAMQKGVAVVRYSCDGIEVLRACTVPGEYAYSPVSLKEKVVRMDDKAAVQANFGTGLSFVKGVEAEIAAGRSLQLAYVMAGMRSTTVPRVSGDELEGRCDGATHFVYDVSLGAFAMDTAANGEAMAAADLFGRGASVSGGSEKSVARQDGDPEACKNSAGTDDAAAGCGAPLRVSLFAIDEARSTATATPTRRDARTCPAGFVWSDDQCIEEAKAESFLCEVGDLKTCVAQCKKGSDGSCGRAAVAFNDVLVDRDAGRDAKQSTLDEMEPLEDRFRQACDSGEGPACTAVAYIRFRNLTGPEKERNQAEGVKYSEKGCLNGEAQACRMIRRAYLTTSGQIVGVELDPEKFISILQRGCARGSALPCQFLGEAYALGSNVEKDLDTARSFARRACHGDRADACMLAGGLELGGDRCESMLKRYAAMVPKDVASKERNKLSSICPAEPADVQRGTALRASACDLGEESACKE
jgi:hypothetical protein